MDPTVKLTFKEGVKPGKEFVFRNRMTCTVGRADDCYLRIPNDIAHWDVSRHHCLLEINPPEVRVRDLGSKNGTFVNGTKIGQRAPQQRPETAAVVDLPECSLHGGDEIRVGSTVLRVEVDPPEE
jgi:pSer/pThr/pTyr-binding forkhead associated (FHA) protein